jgi:hypothetical protein
MKTNMRIVLVSVAFLAIASGCVKENQMPNNEGANHKVTIFASIPDEGMETKVTPSQDAIKTAVKLAWENTDYIYINSEKFSVVSISADGKTAEFSGDDPGSGPYSIRYSKDFSSVVDQTQTQDGTLDHLKYAAAISGADSYENLSFSSTWATAHGATFTSSSVLELRAKLPATIASSVKKVIFTFPENITVDNKRITVSLTTPGVQSGDNILDVYATLPDGNINLPNILVQFQVSDKAYEKYSAYREFASTNVIAGGTTQYLGIDCTKIESYANASSTNIGQATNPYLIGDKYQMNYLHTAMAAGTTYVKLVDDVDLNSEAWTPLNTSSPYNKGIDFDGNGKTIKKLSSSGKYASFVGVLYGSVYNVTFDQASISTEDTNAGVVAGYLGTIVDSDVYKGSCHHITVKNSTLTSTSTTKGYFGGVVGRVYYPDADVDNCRVVSTTITSAGSYSGSIIGAMMSSAYNVTNCSAASDVTVTATGIQHIGGLIGRITEACTVEKCSFSGSVTGGTDVGGIVGSSANVAMKIKNCFTSGSVAGGAGNQRCGGLVGELGTGGSIINSYSTASVSSARVCGGIVGRACSVGWTTTTASGNSISNCIAFNSAVTASAKGDYGSSGAVVGFTSCKNTLSNCYRLYNMTYSNSNNTTEYITTMVDQPNCDGTNWTLGTTIGTSAPNQCPYYGVAAASSATVSSVAQSLGWDGNIWDFSTDLPTLK